MNIFLTDISQKRSAINLDDKRVIKMTLESAQMLSTSLYCKGEESPYKPTHINHPCTIWVRISRNNYEWLLEHFYWLCKEYTHRYNKIHSCEQYFNLFKKGVKFFPQIGLTPFVDCTIGVKGRYEKKEDIIEKYRRFLIKKWRGDKRKPNWKGRKTPCWYRPVNTD